LYKGGGKGRGLKIIHAACLTKGKRLPIFPFRHGEKKKEGEERRHVPGLGWKGGGREGFENLFIEHEGEGGEKIRGRGGGRKGKGF